ncbi:hypothetical protein DUP93_23655, partial [Salmonella enterica subsp. enterica serovar Toulon]|nr:hypothetical protein [Salmonella enterica subsp. enterica serovar Toulon]
LNELNFVMNYVFTLETWYSFFVLRRIRIRIFECPHRLSDKLLKSRCDAAFSSPSRGGVYYAFLFLSQAFIFAFLTDFLTKPF